MLVNVAQIENENIIVVRYKAPFNPNIDIVAAQEQIATLLSTIDGVAYRIDDLSEAQMSWNQFVDGIFVATRDVPGSMTDPRIQGILVGEYEMVRLASESMKQDQYGSTNTPMYTSLDEALKYARENVMEAK